MRNIAKTVALFLGCSLFGSVVVSCGGRGETSRQETTSTPKPAKAISIPQNYCILVENSGSMQGYFSDKGTSGLETIITEYYDRLTQTDKNVKLGYVNVRKEYAKNNISQYRNELRSKCTHQYTKIDDILSMSVGAKPSDTVNICISDYSFTSPDGNLQTAGSSITKLFYRKLKENKDECVAILKYMVGFDGKYYPGGIKCRKEMPVYLWVFGNVQGVKEVLNLRIKEPSVNSLLLQSQQLLSYKLDTSRKRAIKDNCIIVKQWEKERDGKYRMEVKVNMANVVLPKEYLLTKSKYKIASTSGSKYSVDSIQNHGDEYIFTISTSKPSPGDITLSYGMKMPKWVERYNYEDSGLPADSTTFGIKHLIGGVYDAYINSGNNYFTFTIKLQ